MYQALKEDQRNKLRHIYEIKVAYFNMLLSLCVFYLLEHSVVEFKEFEVFANNFAVDQGLELALAQTEPVHACG